MSLFGFWKKPQSFSRFTAIRAGRVELEGSIEALSTLPHPITGEDCVALEYRALPPSMLSVHGVPHSSRAFTVEAAEARDFVLFDGQARVLVQVGDDQDDVLAVHEHLLEQHGLRLQVEIAALRPGMRARVLGRAELGHPGPAYRSIDYVAVIAAERFWQT